jgi:hypothetical protein
MLTPEQGGATPATNVKLTPEQGGATVPERRAEDQGEAMGEAFAVGTLPEDDRRSGAVTDPNDRETEAPRHTLSSIEPSKLSGTEPSTLSSGADAEQRSISDDKPLAPVGG